MKRTALSRKTALKPKCVCGRPRRAHRWNDVAMKYVCRESFCDEYRPKPMKRGASLKPSRKPLKPKKSDPKKRRFSQRRNPEYLAFIRQQPCLIATMLPASHKCWTPVEAAHIKSRGAGGADIANTLPICAAEHRRQHTIGIQSWTESLGMTYEQLVQAGAAYFGLYDVSHGRNL